MAEQGSYYKLVSSQGITDTSNIAGTFMLRYKRHAFYYNHYWENKVNRW